MTPEAHGAQVLQDPDYRPKNIICPPLKQSWPTTFVSLSFCQVEQLRLYMHSRPFLGPPHPWFRVMARSRRSILAKDYYWKGVLHLLYHKIFLKMIDHGSRSTWGPGPSRSRLQDQKYDLPPLKQTFPTTFVL
jgi:hypothetical protein